VFLLPFSVSDSPGVPPSANAHELFRGFSFIAPCLLEEQTNNQPTERQTDPQAKVNAQCACIIYCVCWGMGPAISGFLGSRGFQHLTEENIIWAKSNSEIVELGLLASNINP
jgi:hypothetical protein